MSIPRFYIQDSIPGSGSFFLPDAASHHASRVLRLVEGDALVLFDGSGKEFECRISQAKKAGMSVEIMGCEEIDRESGVRVTLVQSLCSNEKMDWVVQKAVELGVEKIQAVEAKRSVVRLSGERARRREEHWRSVAISACEQCGRNVIPEIPEIVALDQWLASRNEGLKLLLSIEGTPLREFSAPQENVFVLIGPEGGLAPEEEHLARSRGFRDAKLGARILRTETAGLAALAAIDCLWG
ncbi:MAG: 16S rRNA (uracil(1498)-N(3))-methyltransferase [Burkholderiales bacterium]|nr:16S rRNA (uracil(1498)-N(3))-methyltransferase [Burkholderiales bacterium]